MSNRKNRITSPLWMALLFLTTFGAVNAATVQLDGQTATGITGLEIDFGSGAEFWDVDFLETNAETLYGIHPATAFPFGVLDSVAMNEEIIALLNGSTATSVGPAAALSDSDYSFMFLSEKDDDRGTISFAGVGGIYVFGDDWGDKGLVTLGDTALGIFADFTPADVSPIPVPAAFWLFGTALIGFIGVSRRRVGHS